MVRVLDWGAVIWTEDEVWSALARSAVYLRCGEAEDGGVLMRWELWRREVEERGVSVGGMI